MDNFSTFILIVCGVGLVMLAFFGILVALAVRSDRAWKREANYIIAYGLLDSGKPHWSGRTKSAREAEHGRG